MSLWPLLVPRFSVMWLFPTKPRSLHTHTLKHALSQMEMVCKLFKIILSSLTPPGVFRIAISECKWFLSCEGQERWTYLSSDSSTPMERFPVLKPSSVRPLRSHSVTWVSASSFDEGIWKSWAVARAGGQSRDGRWGIRDWSKFGQKEGDLKTEVRRAGEAAEPCAEQWYYTNTNLKFSA